MFLYTNTVLIFVCAFVLSPQPKDILALVIEVFMNLSKDEAFAPAVSTSNIHTHTHTHTHTRARTHTHTHTHTHM